MSQPVRLADLIPAALDAFRAPRLVRVSAPPSLPTERDESRPGLSQVLARVDATLRRAA